MQPVATSIVACRPLAHMIFRAVEAVNDLRPWGTARSESERVIDSLRRPEARAAKRSTEKSGQLAMRYRCVPGVLDFV